MARKRLSVAGLARRDSHEYYDSTLRGSAAVAWRAGTLAASSPTPTSAVAIRTAGSIGFTTKSSEVITPC